ncbi:MAG: hypothetical protein QOI38_1050 [Sphingomonadales bacterium]|jgi:hypothetical protein|nr:hypothetical protein [Sphingomonadales bacterium]
MESLSTIARVRHHEAARIARWFRETDYGLVYFDRRGRAFPVSERERERWEARALKQVEKHLLRLNRLPIETFGIAFLLLTAAGIAAGLVGDSLGPVAKLWPASALPALLWPLLGAWQFRRQRDALRAEIEDRLILRDPIPQAEADAKRRYNIFFVGQVAIGLAILAIAGVGAARGDERFGIVPMLALAAVGYLLMWAARRVDSTHRRKLS